MFRLSAEMAVIRLYDAWARFCRELVILSAGGAPHTANGIPVPRAPGIRGIKDVIPTLMQTYSRRRFEPGWARGSECIDAAVRLRINNLMTVQAAIGATNSPAEELRLVRNFFAHRSLSSAQEIYQQNWHPSGNRLNIENLTARMTTGGVTVMESWILNLQIVAEVAIQ